MILTITIMKMNIRRRKYCPDDEVFDIRVDSEKRSPDIARNTAINMYPMGEVK